MDSKKKEHPITAADFRATPAPGFVELKIDLTPKMRKAFDAMAARNGRTPEEEVAAVICDGLEREARAGAAAVAGGAR